VRVTHVQTGALLCLPQSLPHLSPRRRSQRGARAAQRARTTLTPTSGDAPSATRKAPAAHPRSTRPRSDPPKKPSRNGYNPPTRRCSPKPIPQNENRRTISSGHPHSCLKTLKRAICVCGQTRILLISCVIDSQRIARRGDGSRARADSLRTDQPRSRGGRGRFTDCLRGCRKPRDRRRRWSSHHAQALVKVLR
jgi:hypothetical protein